MLIKQLPRSIKLRLIMISIIVMMTAGMATWLSLDTTRLVSNHANILVEKHIPKLHEIGALQAALHQRILQLYLYYATTDSEHWLVSERKRNEFVQHLQVLDKLDKSLDETEPLEQLIAILDQEAQRFHQEMSKVSGRNWDLLREHLANSQTTSERLENMLSDWASRIQENAGKGGSRTMQEVLRLNRTQMAFSIVILCIGLFVLGMLRGRLRDQDELHQRAYFDRLTGLPNRRYLEEDWPKIKKPANKSKQTALLLINLDRYQLLTGTFGHILVDQAVLAISRRLQRTIAPYAGRSELYQFAPATWLIVYHDPADHSDSRELAQALVNATQEPLQLGERELTIAFSIGVTYYPVHGENIDDLLRNADSSLHEAQAAGGSRYTVYHPDMKRKSEIFLSTESALRHGLKNNEFELHFQPKLAAADLSCIGAEALIRWRRNGELVSPFAFIPVAEKSGLIIAIGQWVIEEACRQWRAWADAGMPQRPIAVNVSAQQFQLSGFTDQLSAALQRFAVPPAMLELEITEEATFGDPQRVVATMEALKKIGVTLAIDDFGTGYSSLSYLKSFPVDVLKIDRAFVHQMESSAQDLSIVRMIVTLARELNFKVVAEGVETEYHQNSLCEIGCDFLQGYLYSRPVPATEYQTYLNANAANLEAAISAQQ